MDSIDSTNNNNDDALSSWTLFLVLQYIVYSLISVIIIVVINHKLNENRIHQETNGIPTKDFLKVLPIIGDVNMILHPMDYQEYHHSNYGYLFATWFLNEPHIVIAGPDMIDQVFYDNARHLIVEGPKSINELILGKTSIFSATGDEHKRLRKLVISHLGVPCLDRLFPGFVQIFNSTIESWVEKTKDGCYINIVPEVEIAVWKAMILIVFGDDIDKIVDDELRVTMSTMGLGVFALPIDLPYSRYSIAMKARARFIELLCEEYKRRQSMPDRGVNRKDMFQTFINETCNDGHPEGFNIDLAVGVIYASLDTTKSTTLLMINTMIDRNLEWIKVKKDLENVFGKEGLLASDATYSRMEKEAPYATACLKEVLRINGVGMFSMRKVATDMELNHRGKKYKVPAGYKIYLSHYHNGINPESPVFSSPTSFIPERFMGDEPEDKKSGFKCSTSSFGGGERICPGNPVAKLEVQIFMGLMSKFRWTRKVRVKEWEIIPFPIPKEGLYIRASPL